MGRAGGRSEERGRMEPCILGALLACLLTFCPGSWGRKVSAGILHPRELSGAAQPTAPPPFLSLRTMQTSAPVHQLRLPLPASCFDPRRFCL